MASTNPELNITKNVRTIEWLKGEMVTAVGTLFKALARDSEEAMVNALAGLILSCYFLGKRLGLSFQKIDDAVEQRLQLPQMQQHEIEEWYGDVSSLENYWQERKPSEKNQL